MSSRRPLILLAVLLLAVLATYGPVLRNDFVNFDDEVFIRDNPDFNPPRLAALLAYWKGPYYGGAFPLTYTVIGGLAWLARGGTGGMDPAVFHAASRAMHAACAALAFLILRQLLRRDRPAALGAAVFALHPLQVESVAWATNVNTLLSCVFALGALWLYLRYARVARAASGGRGGRRWRSARTALFVAATIAFVLAMLSKPTVVTLPLVAAALDVGWVRRRARDVVGPAALWLALTVPFVLATQYLLRVGPGDSGGPPWQRPIVALDALAFYLAKIAWPATLAVDYGRSPEWLAEHGPIRWSWLVPVAVAAVLAALIARRRDRAVAGARAAAVAMAFVAPLLPVLGLVPFHFQEYSTVADRYVYLPLLAVGWAVGWGMSRVRSRHAWTLAAVIVVALAVRSHLLVHAWRDTRTLFAHALRVNPASLAAHNMLAHDATRRGDATAAHAHYAAAVRLHPSNLAAKVNLANLLLRHGRAGEALPLYEAALRQLPGNADVLNNYGAALAGSGDFAAAAEQFEAALAVDPARADARDNLRRARARLQLPPTTSPRL